MSHVTALSIQVKDLAALALACQRLGLNLNLNQKNYKWYGQFVGDYREAGVNPAEMGKCDHSINVVGNKEAYEIGVAAKKGSPGIFELRYDFYGGQGRQLEAVAGNRCSRLIEEYTKIVAIKEAVKIAEARGYQVTTRDDLATGDIIILLSGHKGEYKMTLSKPPVIQACKVPAKKIATQAPAVAPAQKIAPIAPVKDEIFKLKVEGVRGDSCKELTKALEDAMGIVNQTENTDEFYAEQQDNENRLEDFS